MSRLLLEKKLGRGAVCFNEHQHAVQAVTELLCRQSPLIPFVMSIMSRPASLTGVLRGGGAPILVDVDASTGQMQPALVAEMLEENDLSVVILTRPANTKIDPRLIEVCTNRIVILDSDVLSETAPFAFNIYPLFNLGTLVSTPDFAELKEIRSGRLGMEAGLYDDRAVKISEKIEDWTCQRSDKPLPLYKYPEFRKRWMESPDYPVAEQLFSSYDTSVVGGIT